MEPNNTVQNLFNAGIRRIGEPQKPSKIMVLGVKGYMKERLLNICRDTILLETEAKNDGYQVNKEGRTSKKTVIEARLVGTHACRNTGVNYSRHGIYDNDLTLWDP